MLEQWPHSMIRRWVLFKSLGSNPRNYKELGIQQTRIMEIVKGRRAISADTAFRLARYFDTTPQMWISLQKNYELEVAQREAGAKIHEDVTPYASRDRKVG